MKFSYYTVFVATNVHLSIPIQGIHDQINGLDDFVSVGWIGVNMKPAKHLVCALITKWIYVYTSFLTKQVINVYLLRLSNSAVTK